MQTKTLNVADEIAALGDALQALIGDIVAKKSVAQITTDVLPNVIAAVSGYSAIGTDIALADDDAYLVRAIKLGINGK